MTAEVLSDELPPGNWPAIGSVPVSVLIPAKNEESNIGPCLRHVRWAGQLVVVDSQSTDRTVPIAESLGAEVVQFQYSKEGWPKKKNWALESVPWRHDWVLIVDADEHMTPELAREIESVVSRDAQRSDSSEVFPSASPQNEKNGYYLNRRFMFMGRWIKHCGYYPSWNLRLFKHRLGRYERIGALGDTGSGDNEVHEHVVLSSGEAGYLKNDFLHFAYPDLATWVEKHNRYTTWEAHAMLAGDIGGVKGSPFGGPIERRRWLKSLTRRLPFRPWLRFLYSYVLKGGFLDGYPGYCMCRLLAWYEFMSSAKHYEMTHREKS
jgi:glycosyltransferase involved in cell wall biosynthesis